MLFKVQYVVCNQHMMHEPNRASVQGVSDRGVCVLGVSVWGVYVRGGSVLSPIIMYGLDELGERLKKH